ncbi:hypothetical protein E4U57_004321 [Claviceps arundinis]|uniref:GDP/GTP exchange factor Sec2 N-terminal domain-containing protein n=1 Tax=Claviceps arundinis TaxID=1623583 RepID=A0A9P7SMD4_9HYPO|nr:hypothetical protein E4U57_004321 [Claviceps arundinis]KAG5959615.1 hypothetical protein E4U56_004895 [Claviceps arundinis]
MDPLIYAASCSQQQPSSSRPPSGRALGHIRSLSSVASIPSSSSPVLQRPRLPAKSPSTSQLPTISLTSPSAATQPLPAVTAVNNEMSTLPDPRSRPRSPTIDDSQPSPEYRPNLDDEVATLSTKLINAINYQTVLDDSLSAARHELSAAQARIGELEAQNESLRETIRGDVWVRRSTLDSERRAMQVEKKVWQAKLAEEANKRIETDKEKRKIEQELENLTTALFEEANRMVIGAKEDAQAQHDVLQRKIDQLKGQLVDSESLLKSQQEQLSELKSVMESMASGRDDQTCVGTAPPSPTLGKFDHEQYNHQNGRAASAPHGQEPTPSAMEAFSPCPPTSLQHLVHPVVRTDLAAYDDFTSLARLSHNRCSPSRVSAGSMRGLNALALGLGGSTSSAHASIASTASLSASTPADRSAPQSPKTPASTISNGSTSAPAPPLKDTRFYKRALVEDIDPTLRLDLAPGLSWLARRTVSSAIAEGSLVVEPIPSSATYIAISKPQLQPCSLCGESRKEPHYLRNYRFRTSEAESAQRYPLCNYCLNRVRSTCDYLGFLRVVKDGHWRADDEDPERAAWVESVKLRDQMFWARMGGGVVPVNPPVGEVPSARCSSEDVCNDDANASNDDSTPTATTLCCTPENRTREGADAGAISGILDPRMPPGQMDVSGAGKTFRITVQAADSLSSDAESIRRPSIVA